ncbi:S1 RNA-binding domain-containing protein [Streptococcus pneumoniae]|nr:S1 RNA-binding domain-containing protein [Streptococcus pneumoniae]
MGLFFYNKIGSIISIVDLPTTNIIEPKISSNHVSVALPYVWLLTLSVSSTTSKQCFELTSSVSSTTSKLCFELTSSVSSTTSKPCFEPTSSVSSTTSKLCFELTSSVLSTTSKQCFEQPAASFLVCSLIFIEY